jgi:ATP-dependent DNA helicase Rep
MLHDLNPSQQQAVRNCNDPMLILAGAGSGKTRVLTRKIAYLIRQKALSPASIVAVTFTNKAAREMQARVAKLLDAEAAKEIHVSTFHTLGLKIIREEPRRFMRKRGFTIYDAADSLSLLKDIMRRDYGDPGNLAEQVQWTISNWKQLALSPNAVQLQGNDAITQTALQVYHKYEAALQTYNAVDFDDLILKPLVALRTDHEYRNLWQCRIRHLLVDEYQDTNLMQYELIKQLVGRSGAFTVVGDDDQSIYSWRGARPENLAQLKQDYPHLQLIKLEQNYRSTGTILKAANALIANNPHVFEKKLWSQLGPGDAITVLSSQTDEQEAEQVIGNLLQHKFQKGTSFSDYAILYRSNHQSRMFEQQLREKDVPYYLSGGISFFALSEIKDLMAYLRIVANPEDDNALLRIINTPRRELGPATVQNLVTHAATLGHGLLESTNDITLQTNLNSRACRNISEFRDWIYAMHRRSDSDDPLKLTRSILNDIGYEQWLHDTSPDEIQAKRRLDNVNELLKWIERIKQNDLSADLTSVVSKLTLVDTMERDKDKENNHGVHLMTLHAAKGLEFPFVYLVGMEENILPHRNSIEEESIEEERRLAYVGMTRAQQQLTLSYTMQRKSYGKVLTTEPSRFLTELPDELVQRRGVQSDLSPEQQRENGQHQLAHLRSLLVEG